MNFKLEGQEEEAGLPVTAHGLVPSPFPLLPTPPSHLFYTCPTPPSHLSYTGLRPPPPNIPNVFAPAACREFGAFLSETSRLEGSMSSGKRKSSDALASTSTGSMIRIGLRPEQAPPPFRLRLRVDGRRRNAKLLPPAPAAGATGAGGRRLHGKRPLRLDMAEGTSPFVAWDGTLMGTGVQCLVAVGVWVEGRIVGFNEERGTHRVRRQRPPPNVSCSAGGETEGGAEEEEEDGFEEEEEEEDMALPDHTVRLHWYTDWEGTPPPELLARVGARKGGRRAADEEGEEEELSPEPSIFAETGAPSPQHKDALSG